MFEDLGFETLTAPQAAVWLGLILGLAFGVLAQITRFCFRSAILSSESRQKAAAIWVLALATAFAGTQVAVSQGLISFADHRFFQADLPWLAIIAGGVMFGAGMVLTRGCASRLTVLAASGNLRALLMILVFGLVAHSTLKGVLAPVRTTLGQVTLPYGDLALPGSGLLWALPIAALAIALTLRARLSPALIVASLALGLLVPLGWVGTGYILFDDFDPVAMESLSFTSPAANSVFYAVASTAIVPSFGVTLIAGTLIGALLSSLIRREFVWQSFEGPAQTGRYLAGASLMGVGGVLAGGCTVGAGLAGLPTLSIAAGLALASIAAGGLAAARITAPVSASRAGSAGSSTTPAAQQAA